jgi:hypothetical protein
MVIMIETLPFIQTKREGKLIRKFSPSVDDYELKWHQDEKDRIVTVIESGGWSFQLDDNLPNKLQKEQKLHIPKFVWHRVIKGNEDLIVEIEEVDL